MDKKTLEAKTVKELKMLSKTLDLPIPANLIKIDLINLITKHHKKQQRLAAKQALKKLVTSNESPSEANESSEVPVEQVSTVKPKSILKKRVEKPQARKESGSKEKVNGKQKVEADTNVKKSNDGKYTIVNQLGSPGKEGTTFLVATKKGDEFAMKKFAMKKSVQTLQKEANYQKIVAKHGLAPKIKEVNEEYKYIVMEKLDRNLFDIVKKHNGEIPDNIQRKIIQVISGLDDTGVFHGDPNPANFMLKGSDMYMIDYGFAKNIDDNLIKKFETTTPNQKFMIVGLILKIKRDL